MYVYLYEYMSFVCSAHGGQKREPDPPGARITEGYELLDLCAGNRTPVLCKSNKYSNH